MNAPRTILVIDDDAEFSASVSAALRQEGYRVLNATDGNMGLSAAEREAPDLVVLDMMMPRTSGFLVLERLKQRPAPAPKVIMVTINEGVKHRAYAQSLGVDDYLCKPFPVERLVESVLRLCPRPDIAVQGDPPPRR